MDTVAMLNDSIIEAQRELAEEVSRGASFKKESNDFLIKWGDSRCKERELTLRIVELRTKKSILEVLGHTAGDVEYNGNSLNDRREEE